MLFSRGSPGVKVSKTTFGVKPEILHALWLAACDFPPQHSNAPENENNEEYE